MSELVERLGLVAARFQRAEMGRGKKGYFPDEADPLARWKRAATIF